MATDHILHGDYVRIKYGPHADECGFVYMISGNNPNKWSKLTIDLDGGGQAIVYEPDVERAGIAMSESRERMVEAIRDKGATFKEGDMVKVMRDLTGREPDAVGLVGRVIKADHSRIEDDLALSVVVEDDEGRIWDCNPDELRRLSELEVDQVAISGAAQATLRRVAYEQTLGEAEGFTRKTMDLAEGAGYYDRFEDIAQELIFTHNQKGADYGVAEDPYANVRSATDYGLPAWVGVAIRMQDKMRRIQAASRQWGETGEVSLANESLEDAFLDAAVYGIIGLIMLRDEAEGTSP